MSAETMSIDKASRCERYVDTERWVLICNDVCHCSSPLCGNCDQPLQYHHSSVKDAWFDAD